MRHFSFCSVLYAENKINTTKIKQKLQLAIIGRLVWN
jgi:hypothetical protein